MSAGIIIRPKPTVLPGSALVERFVGAKSFTPASFAKFVQGHSLKLRPGQTFTINASDRHPVNFIRGLNKRSPFAISILHLRRRTTTTKDIPTSQFRIGVKPGAKAGASDTLALVSSIGAPGAAMKPTTTTFRLSVASGKDV